MGVGMKSICTIASKDATADGDVIFYNKDKISSFDNFVCMPNGNVLHCTEKGLIISGDAKNLSIKLMVFWFWHMKILRKPYVYLTGVNK